MYNDYHLHTNFSGDSKADHKDIIERAIQLQMKEICITDHHDYLVDSKEICFELDVEHYVKSITKLQEDYKDKIRISMGIELGLQRKLKEYLEGVEGRYPFDFIIGSCHFVDGMDPYFPEFFYGKKEEEAYARFFEVTLKRVQALDCFDVLGHLDYVVRYGPNKNLYYTFEKYQEYMIPILKALVEKGIGLECNSGGLKYGLGTTNPSKEILRCYRKLGGEIITIGSDAHTSEFVGYEFNQVGELLKECGFTYYSVFHNRNPNFLPL